MSRVKNPTRGPRARAAETAAATAALAEADTTTRSAREQRRRLEGAIRTVSENARAWEQHGSFPRAAARAWEIVDECKERLAALGK